MLQLMLKNKIHILLDTKKIDFKRRTGYKGKLDVQRNWKYKGGRKKKWIVLLGGHDKSGTKLETFNSCLIC